MMGEEDFIMLEKIFFGELFQTLSRHCIWIILPARAVCAGGGGGGGGNKSNQTNKQSNN